MCINRIGKCFLVFAVVLSIVSCASPEQPAAKLVFVETVQDSSKTSLQFHCNEYLDCYPPVLLPLGMEWTSRAETNREGDLFIPFRTSRGDKYGSVGYVKVGRFSQDFITGQFPGSKRFDYLIDQVIFSGNKMIFTIEGDSYVYILDETGKMRDILIEDIEPDAPHFTINKGTQSMIIVVGESLKRENAKHLIDISVIDLTTYTVESRLVSWPETVVLDTYSKHELGKKYNVLLNGITSNGQQLYYQYFGLNDKTQFVQQVGIYNLQTGNDRSFQIQQGNCSLGIREYKGFFYRNGISNDICRVSPILASIDDFHSIIDFKKIEASSDIVRIAPFDDSFLIVSDEKIVQIDFSGNILQEFQVPPPLAGGDYVIAQFEN